MVAGSLVCEFGGVTPLQRLLYVMLLLAGMSAIASESSCAVGKSYAINERYDQAFESWGRSARDLSPKEHLRAVLECLETVELATDSISAARWIVDIARRTSNAKAQMYAGMLYVSGAGVERDIEKGKQWLRSAATRGNDDARQLLEILETYEP